MNIRIDKYGIETLDRLQVVLVEYKTVQDENSKNYGQETKKILGYFGDTGLAMYRLYELMVRESDAQSVAELIKAFESSKQAVTEMIEECRSQNV
jgi:putative heme degradation protein